MISGFHIYSSVPRFPRFELNFFGKIAVVSAYHFGLKLLSLVSISVMSTSFSLLVIVGDLIVITCFF